MRIYRLGLFIVGLALMPCITEAELKIGYIDSQALMEQLPEFREAQQSLMQLKQDYENQAQDRDVKLRKMQEDFKRQELLLSEARKAEMQAEFEEKVQQLQLFTQEKLGPEGELMRKNIELMEPIFNRINDAIKLLAEESGYDYVLDSAAQSASLVYANEKYDLTETLIEAMEKQKEDQGK
jgi:outer membrane protein